MSRRIWLLVLSFAICLSCLSGCASHSKWGLKTEHIAFDVASPEKTAEWWCRNLGFECVIKQSAPPFAIFIREAKGQFAVELYRAANTPEAPDYHQLNPLQCHIAFISMELDHDIARLTAAGATLLSRQIVQGSELVMLRDPSGIPFQLVSRQIPVLK